MTLGTTEDSYENSFDIARKEDISYILETLGQGECCSIVGMSNIGKSHLLRSLRKPEVRKQFLGEIADKIIVIYVDFNLMWEMTDQGFYEVILRGIMSEIDHLTSDEHVIRRARESYQNLIHPSSPFLVPVSFNEGLMAFNPEWERRLVLLFDEFDEPWANIDRRAFLNLRALRDRYRGSLCYVTATVHHLPEIRPGREIGEFCELFTHRTRHLAPLTANEARQFMGRFAQSEGISFDEADIAFAFAQADGHPGLLEATSHVLAQAKNWKANFPSWASLDYARVREMLWGDDVVRTECAKLWNDLDASEQETLLALTTGQGFPDQRVLEHLLHKHIVVERNGQLTPFCQLLGGFVQRQHRVRYPPKRGVRVDVESGDVWVDGNPIPTLTDLEYKLMLLLYGNLNKIVDKYTIVETVWGENYIDQVHDASIEKLISRLRQKMGEDSADPRYLKTIRGRGYRLVSPTE